MRWRLIHYLSLFGILVCVGVNVGLYFALRYYDLTLHEFAVKAVEKADLRSDWIDDLLTPAPRFHDHVLDGRLKTGRPRILLPELATWDGSGVPELLSHRERLYEESGIRLKNYPPCYGKGPFRNAACWLATGSDAAALRGIDELRGFKLTVPEETGTYGNAYRLAIAYDLLSLHPGMTDAIRDAVEAKLVATLEDYLPLLDGRGPSLWHGRASLASQAWITAVALTAGDARRDDLIRRAQGHFVETIRSVALTEGWPEGYNYWVNSRALILALAAAAYINGLENANSATFVRDSLERLGLWTVYMSRPDGRVVASGDEGPRVDLKDETRRVIDLIGQLTRNPVFTSFSRYIEALHGQQSYYRAYRWQFRLFNDPTVPPVPGIEVGSLAGMSQVLPRAAQFGAGALNQIVARTGWDEDATMLTFRAGHTFTHHGPYDAGHFTLFKGAPLAITNATYHGNIKSPHRLYYGIRTVSKNSILVLRPGEEIKPSRLVTENVVDGGQRVIIPTGSAVLSVQDWYENLGDGRHFEGGDIESYQFIDDRFLHVRSNITKAYDNTEFDSQGDNGKVKLILRELLYLLDEDWILIHDAVTATRPEYTKKWLLHLPQRPEIPGLQVLFGSSRAGIMESRAARFFLRNGSARLDVTRLAPDDALIRLVGGPGFEYYVETDADDSDFNGKNFYQGAEKKDWFDNGLWRIEVQPNKPATTNHFLISLQPGLGRQPGPLVGKLDIREGSAQGAFSDRSVILFCTDQLHHAVSFKQPGAQSRLLIAGVVGGQALRVETATGTHRLDVRKTGLIHIPITASAGTIVKISAIIPAD